MRLPLTRLRHTSKMRGARSKIRGKSPDDRSSILDGSWNDPGFEAIIGACLSNSNHSSSFHLCRVVGLVEGVCKVRELRHFVRRMLVPRYLVSNKSKKSSSAYC